MFPEHQLAGANYLSHENPIPFPANLGMFHQGNTNTNTLQAYHLNRLLTNFQPAVFQEQLMMTTPQYSSCSLSNNSSTSDEAEDEHHLQAIDERKRRRMISNRESARRSRMRKQRHLDELQFQISRLLKENNKLVEKFNQVSQSLDRVLQENATLKEEASDLRQMISDLRICSPFHVNASAFRDLDDVPCNASHLRAESSNQSVSSCVDLLH